MFEERTASVGSPEVWHPHLQVEIHSSSLFARSFLFTQSLGYGRI
jgi:hypothetical protein